MVDTLPQLVELGEFINSDVPAALKLKALEYIQGVTRNGEYGPDLLQEGSVIEILGNLAEKDKDRELRTACIRTLVNFTTNDVVASASVLLKEPFVISLLKDVVNENSKSADYSAMVLSNLTRIPSNAEYINSFLGKLSDLSYKDLFSAFTKDKYNLSCPLHYLGSFLSNMTTLKDCRTVLLSENKDILLDVPAYLNYEGSVIRRSAAARILKNCSFESEYHQWLLSDDVDLLPQLLLPLAGPEELAEKEMEKLPLDLQYLPESKTRESDPEIRLMLVNTLHQLCTTKQGREVLWNNGVYYILREMHKQEKDGNVEDALLLVVQILLGDEPEHGMENLKAVAIPPELQEKFQQEDALLNEQKGM